MIASPAETASAPLDPESLRKLHAYWRAANYLSAAQIYLMRNALLRDPLQLADIKPRLLGHWGTTPGLNFVYAHLNRIIRAHDCDMLFVAGPGHGGPGMVANTYLEGTYTERFPHVTRDNAGLDKLVKQFSFPGGIPSHAGAPTPGSIHEGGELGYSLAHAFGAAFDNPDLIVACVVGDGEAESGPLAASWHCNKFLNPRTDGAVLPILHLNGYKIANPTILARIAPDDLDGLMRGYGYKPHYVEGHDPEPMHQRMASVLDACYAEIRAIQDATRNGADAGSLPCWPMIVLRSPKGWTGPKVVDGKPVEGNWRAHQVPLEGFKDNPEHLAQLEAWFRSYTVEELFDDEGRLIAELQALAPTGTKRMGSTPYANGGELLRELDLPEYRNYAVAVEQPGGARGESTRVLGTYLRDVMRANMATFRIVGPDETASNRLMDVFDATNRTWLEPTAYGDDHLAPDGRVTEVLSEHICQGLLEGYLLTGRHGLFNCYEAFIHIVDSMVNQHAKWIKTSREIEWRRPISSLTYLLTSHVWRQDHNGFSHQDPGFLDHVANKKPDTVRIYLPPDANTLLYTMDHCFRSRDRINVVVAGKQPEWQWLDMEAAVRHCVAGLGIWGWASSDHAEPADAIIATAGDVPTMEGLAAVAFLREELPDLRIRFVNIVDLMTLMPHDEHPHGLPDREFRAIFTPGTPIVFNFHGYASLVHRLTYGRAGTDMHVRGYREEGTTTTPFDMTVRNKIDRYHLAGDVVDHVPRVRDRAGYVKQKIGDLLVDHHAYIDEHGEDPPAIADWQWTTPAAAS